MQRPGGKRTWVFSGTEQGSRHGAQVSQDVMGIRALLEVGRERMEVSSKKEKEESGDSSF